MRVQRLLVAAKVGPLSSLAFRNETVLTNKCFEGQAGREADVGGVVRPHVWLAEL